jgi:hypothetical protein
MLPIRLLDLESYVAARDGLIALLVEAVAGNAGVSFLPPLAPERAGAFWDGLAAKAAADEAELFAGFDGARVAGTVALMLDTPENQGHRAEIAKM